MNSKLPLEIFLPPEPEWAHINFIVTKNLNGLNAGTFFLRVNEWSIQFITGTLAFPIH